ncbi:MAG: hypothetical protein FWE15_04680 [Actinomycetia bacterium]|nr:hypothetical protein [Actinomycetes bacterium]
MSEPLEGVRAAMPEESWGHLRDRLELAAAYGYVVASADARTVIEEIDGMRRTERYHVAVITRLTDRLVAARDALAEAALEREAFREQARAEGPQ